MRQVRNFVVRLSIQYVLFYILLLLDGVKMEQYRLFGIWSAALVFDTLTVTLRGILLALTLPLIIMTGGLFILAIDGLILVLTAALTGLKVDSFGWALLGVLVMSVANVWVEKAFRAIGWLRDETNGETEADREANVITARSPGWSRRLLLYGILIAGIAFSAAMSSEVFLATATLTRRMPVIAATAASIFTALVFGISWLVAEGLALDRRAFFAGVVAFLAATLIIPLALVQLFTAPPLSGPAPQPRPETAYWELPTGSRIAYSAFAAPEKRHRNPLIFVHGGLGRAVLDTDIAFFKKFAQEGLDVYLYDLVGTGLSGRLPDVREYGIERHVRDLEAIRETIQADRLILVGHAEGAEVVARYMVAHRDRVERAVFYSPTPLWDDEDYFKAPSRTAAGQVNVDELSAMPPVVALAMAPNAPRTAAGYVSQAQMSIWADRYTDHGQMVCAGASALAPHPIAAGYNPYVSIMGYVTDNKPPNLRRRLSEIFVPAILLRGECDPVDWDVIEQYWDGVPNLKAYYVANAGSMLHLSHPEVVREIIAGFVRQETIPLPALDERQIRTTKPPPAP
jgi:proline iminopeptidase